MARENPARLSGRTYVEFFQALDKAIEVPIAVTGVGGLVPTFATAILYRDDRKVLLLTLLAGTLVLVSNLVTIIANVPINHQLVRWNPAALRADYAQIVTRWWYWHRVRLVTLVPAMCFLFAAALIRKRSN